jgi:hypothetical protein
MADALRSVIADGGTVTLASAAALTAGLATIAGSSGRCTVRL